MTPAASDQTKDVNTGWEAVIVSVHVRDLSNREESDAARPLSGGGGGGGGSIPLTHSTQLAKSYPRDKIQ